MNIRMGLGLFDNRERKVLVAMPHCAQMSAPDPKRPLTDVVGVPFATTAEAWFWFMAAQSARNDGGYFAGDTVRVPRPCEPIDILRVLDGLYRNRLLNMDHLRVLRYYGLRFCAPDWSRPKERRAAVLWQQGMNRLEPALIRRGIVQATDWLTAPGAGHA